MPPEPTSDVSSTSFGWKGVNPFYVWFYFKTEPGLRQIATVINGVGTPNINFSEIRALQVALVSEDCQHQVEEEYWDRVLPLHREREGDAAKGGGMRPQVQPDRQRPSARGCTDVAVAAKLS